MKEQQEMSSFADKLVRLRKASGKRQIDVAQACHITRQALSNYELGKRFPDPGLLTFLADYYGVSLDWLLRETAPGPSDPDPAPPA